MAPFVLGVLLGVLGVLSGTRAGQSPSLPVELIAKEFLFEPKEVTARPGEVTFVVKNQGAIEHDFVLETDGRKTVAEISVIEPGQTAEIKAAVEAGTFTIYCSLPGHRDAGMVATLRVSQ